MPRSPGGTSSTTAVPAGAGRDRILISTCLAIVIGLAWAYLLRLDWQMSSTVEYDKAMAAMGMTTDRPWTTTDVLFTWAMWGVMMVGMMAGSAAPVLLLFVAARRGRGQGDVWSAAAMFALGYLLVWIGFSAGATLAQWALRQTAMLSASLAMSSPRAGGVILLIAGTYQLTPFKSACLTQCRTPLGFLMTHWRDGSLGALRMGVGHGYYCLGCCWAVMCVLFVVGVMSLPWVAAMSVFVLMEKVGPAGVVVARVGGAILIAAGLALVSGAA